MQLIDKQNDLSFTVLNFFENGLQSLLELTTVLRAGYQRAHIEGKDLLILQCLRNVTAYDTLRQAFDDRRFTNAGLTDQTRIVFRLTGQDTHDTTDLFITADDRIHLLRSGFFDQFGTVFLQGLVGRLRIIGGHTLVTAHGLQRHQKALAVHAEITEQCLRVAGAVFDERQKQMFDGCVFVAHQFRFVLRADDNFI